MTNSYKEEMLPPWKKYPKINKFSIGWRMGYGEEYLFDWYGWYEELSEDEKKKYKNKYPRPFLWFGFYNS